MPGGQTALAIADHRVRGHRDDRNVPAGRALRAGGSATVAASPSISGIWTSISTTSKVHRRPAAIAFERQPAVGGGLDPVPALLEHARQRACDSPGCPRRPGRERAARLRFGRRHRARAAIAAIRFSEQRHDRVEQVGLFDRLGQVHGDAELPAARDIVRPRRRRQHDSGVDAKRRSALTLPGET